MCGPVAQLVRASPCHGEGRRFESDLGRWFKMWKYTFTTLIFTHGILAQLGEHLPYKQRVIGSSPIGPIFLFKRKKIVFMHMHGGDFLVPGLH